MKTDPGSGSSRAPSLDWPGVGPHEQALWDALGPDERNKAWIRLDALLGLQSRKFPTVASAAAAAQMAPSAFYLMRDRWRKDPSVASLGLRLRPVRTRASAKGDDFKAQVCDAMRTEMKDRALGTQEIVRRFQQRFGLTHTTVLAWLDEIRRSSPEGRVVGRYLSLDLALIDLLDDDGRNYAVVCAVDVGARLVLGAGLMARTDGGGAYGAARRDAERRLARLPLGAFDLSPRLQGMDLQFPPRRSEDARFPYELETSNMLLLLGSFRVDCLAHSPDTRYPRGRALTRAAGPWLGSLRLAASPRKRRNDPEREVNARARKRSVTFEVAEELLAAAMDEYVEEVRQTFGPSDDARDEPARQALREALGLR